jgi:hypothetical protein
MYRIVRAGRGRGRKGDGPKARARSRGPGYDATDFICFGNLVGGRVVGREA